MLQEKWSFERVFMELLMAAASAALRTDAGRLKVPEVHEMGEDVPLHRGLVG